MHFVRINTSSNDTHPSQSFLRRQLAGRDALASQSLPSNRSPVALVHVKLGRDTNQTTERPWPSFRRHIPSSNFRFSPNHYSSRICPGRLFTWLIRRGKSSLIAGTRTAPDHVSLCPFLLCLFCGLDRAKGRNRIDWNLKTNTRKRL